MAKVFKYILDFQAQTKEFEKGVGGVEGMLKTAAIAAGALFAADKIMDAAEAVYDYANQISNTKIAVETLAQVHGAAANQMTGQVTALAQSYDQDVNEAVKATNVLMRSFKADSKEAFDLFNLGLSGAANANGDLLQQITEYSPHFAEARASATEMFAVIAQGQKLGVFDDKAADSIKEASIRLREMTPATKAAIDGIGLSSSAVQKGIMDGSLSMIDVMKQVSGQLNQLPEQAPAVGAALADIFGGPGEDGINFIRALSDIDLTMQGLIDDSVGAQTRWTNELARFHEVGASVFGGFSELVLNVKTTLLQAVNFIIDNFDEIKAAVIAGGAAFVTYKGIMLASSLATNGMTIATTAATVAQKLLNAAMAVNPIGLVVAAIAAAAAAFVHFYKKNEEFRIRVDFAAKWAAAALNKAWISIKMGAEEMWLGIKSYFTAIPKAAGIILDAVKTALSGGNFRDALKDGFGELLSGVAEQAKGIKDKYSDELKAVEMPTWSEFYQSEKSKTEAAASGEADGAEYAKAVQGAAYMAVPKVQVMPELIIKDVKIDMPDENFDFGFGEKLSEQFQLDTSLGVVANQMQEITEKAKAFGDEVDVLAEKKKYLADQINYLISEGYNAEGEAIQGLINEYAATGAAMDDLAAQKQKAIDYTNAVTQASFAATDAVAGIANSWIDSAADTETAMGRFTAEFLKTVIKFISAATGQAIANAIVGASAAGAAAGPAAPIVTPALIAEMVGGVIGAFAAIPKFANGGIAYGPTMGLMGEYPGARTNPEVIAPLSKLQGIMQTSSGGTQEITVTVNGKMRGEDLYFGLEKVSKKVARRG